MKISATKKIIRLSKNPLATSGKDSFIASHEKNCFCTVGHCSEELMIQATKIIKIPVLTALISTGRLRSLWVGTFGGGGSLTSEELFSMFSTLPAPSNS
jgi:hypothetical protein